MLRADFQGSMIAPAMADEIDLRFLAEQGKRILDEFAEARTERAEIRAEQRALASLLGKVSDAVTEIAKVQERHSEILGKLAWRTRARTSMRSTAGLPW
jgi:hypothetical protein